MKKAIKEIKKPITSKKLRNLIIWAKSEIDEYEEFIKNCEKKLKENKNTYEKPQNNKYESTNRKHY